MDGNHQPASMPLHHAIHPGEQMTFGSYPHFADGTVQPIVWRILQNSGNELFLLSEEILDCKLLSREKRGCFVAGCRRHHLARLRFAAVVKRGVFRCCL